MFVFVAGLDLSRIAKFSGLDRNAVDRYLRLIQTLCQALRNRITFQGDGGQGDSEVSLGYC